MPKIQILSQDVADKIAAGEVAERPAAVVKELVENSIDAGATSIEVEIRKGGIEYIRVSDNGCGIDDDQVETAFLRHATSKLGRIEDLYHICTMGFRGEALSSICAVAKVEVITRTKESEEGVFIKLDHGKTVEKDTIACAQGTVMVVKNLFENIPARMKFLKKDSTEAGYVADVLNRIALSHPDISFVYICDGKEIFSTSGDGMLRNTVLKLYGLDHAKGAVLVDYEEENVRVKGVVGKPELVRGNRARQTFFVNGRYIKNHVASKVVGEVYRNSIMTGKFPFFVLDIIISPDCVDVNVHPAKTEIKFANENKVYEILYHAVNNALSGGKEKEQIIPDSKPLSLSGHDADVAKHRGVHHSSGTMLHERTKKVDAGLVREYIESMTPKQREDTPEVKNDDGVIYSKINFLEQKRENMLTTVDNTEKPKEEQSAPEAEGITARPIGQLFDTYILCQADDKFYMIDQHAAHERLRFEELKKSYYSHAKMSQLLLTPIILKLDFSETQTVLSNIDIYAGFGFEIEDFGGGSIIVYSTPILEDEAQIRDLILEIAGAVSEIGKHTIANFEESALDMIACKHAIKANRRLNHAEMEDLAHKVWEMDGKGIRTCPHGRPIWVEFSKYEIEKMFKRIV